MNVDWRKKSSLRYQPYLNRALRIGSCRLLKYQQRAVLWTQRQRMKIRGVVLNMDYGLGKTITSLAHASMFGWNAIYICPPSLICHVRDELKKHFGPAITCHEAKKWDPLLFMEHDVTLVSYHVLARFDVDEMQSNPYVFLTCIIDELEDAVKKKAVSGITQQYLYARFYIGLTGANRIQPAMLNMVHATTMRSVFILRQPANFVLSTHLLELNEKARDSYNHIQAQIVNMSGLKANRLLVNARAIVSLDKTNHVLFCLDKMQSCKTLVVSEFVPTLEHISKKLLFYKQNHILYASKYIKTQVERDRTIHAFENNPKMNIMLADLNLIVFGLDFGFVDVLLVVDLPRELLVYRQLQGRLRRVGQHPKHLKKQEVIQLVTKNTCDNVLLNDIHSSSRYQI